MLQGMVLRDFGSPGCGRRRHAQQWRVMTPGHCRWPACVYAPAQQEPPSSWPWLAAQRRKGSEHPRLALQECWRRNPQERPSFEQLKARMEAIWQAAQQDESLRRGQTGLLSKFRKSKA